MKKKTHDQFLEEIRITNPNSFTSYSIDFSSAFFHAKNHVKFAKNTPFVPYPFFFSKLQKQQQGKFPRCCYFMIVANHFLAVSAAKVPHSVLQSPSTMFLATWTPLAEAWDREWVIPLPSPMIYRPG